MPVITIQIGQCGNQLGQQLWDMLSTQQLDNQDALESAEFFRATPAGHQLARCVMVDSEPKVVNSILNSGPAGMFSSQRCFVGQSGRGNNWAFGYNQLAAVSEKQKRNAGNIWRFPAAADEVMGLEFRMLEHVLEGIRLEVEECDTATDFLMLHSLGGGSGSGMGSKLIEHLREDYPLHVIATASVVPQSARGAPMQIINSVMALSFLQAYADAVLWFDNDDWLPATNKQGAKDTTTLFDINKSIAAAIMGAIWPLDASGVQACQSRLRDMACTVAVDPCMKLLQTRTVWAEGNTPVSSLWQDTTRALHNSFTRFDRITGKHVITTQGALVTARGFPPAAFPVLHSSAVKAFMASCGHKHSTCRTQSDDLVQLRCGAVTLAAGRSSSRTKSPPCLSSVCNRSCVIPWLDTAVRQVTSLCESRAFLHWYEKYGCSEEAIMEAARTVADVAGSYRLEHRFMPQPQKG